MAWAFKPINDQCIDCNKDIDPCAERNYIVWHPQHNNGPHKRKGAYRRECAACHDHRLERPYNRQSKTDAVIMGKPEPQPTLS